MNDIVTSLGVAIEADGATIGGAQDFRFRVGQTREAIHRPLSAESPEVYAGQVDHGRVMFTVHYKPADPGQAALEAAYMARRHVDCVVSFPAGIEWSFKALVREFPVSGQRATGMMSANVVLRISGGISSP